VFETGTNVWRSFDAWPPKAATAKTLYFHAGGKLSFDPPPKPRGVDEYVSDPRHPVPFVGYTTDTVPQRYMVDDQRFASYRPDVLVYETDPLEEDVTIAGPISPKLKIASTGTDSDYDVKLIDVYPENYPDPDDSMNGNKRIPGCAAAAHGRLPAVAARRAVPRQVPQQLGEARAAHAGKEADVNFTMPDLFHTFRRGHRIMVQVQSSWFPLTDRNPQTFTDIPNAKPEDFRRPPNRSSTRKDAASGVEVLVMP
jgi:putative CocE/NonD family hydrolase